MYATFQQLIQSKPVTELLDSTVYLACTNLKLLIMIALTVAIARILRKIEDEKWLDGIELRFVRMVANAVLFLDSIHLFLPHGIGNMFAALSRMVM